MQNLSIKITAFILYSLLIAIINSCGSSQQITSGVSIVPLKEGYDFAKKQNITVLILPSGRENLDRTYSRVLQIDLQSRGYNITDANKYLSDNSDEVGKGNFRQIADSLSTKKYLPPCNIIVIARLAWDRIYLENQDFRERQTDEEINPDGNTFTYILSSYLVFFDMDYQDPILSFAAIDTSHLYSENEGKLLIYSEHPWMTAARQLARELKEIPICQVVNANKAVYQFDVELWVDQSYRNAFPDTWKDRLNLRFLFANDILRSQFDIELILKGFKEWDSEFESTLKGTLNKLAGESAANLNLFRVGITLDKNLKKNWSSRTAIGYAYPLGEFAVITAQPSFPEVGKYWNPIEEAITIVHEVGHLLGAIHVPDVNSVMYPFAGFFSYEFDEINKKIIESTRKKFFNVEKKQRIQNYNQELIKMRFESEKNSFPLLPAISNTIINILPGELQNISEPEKLYSFLTELVADSILVIASIGYIAFKLNNYELAKKLFLVAVEAEPDFAEAHWYLAEIYWKIGKESRAREHRKKANVYRKYWVIDNSL
jgi:tetratricopeptide (TPR) repeat protein